MYRLLDSSIEFPVHLVKRRKPDRYCDGARKQQASFDRIVRGYRVGFPSYRHEKTHSEHDERFGHARDAASKAQYQKHTHFFGMLTRVSAVSGCAPLSHGLHVRRATCGLIPLVHSHSKFSCERGMGGGAHETTLRMQEQRCFWCSRRSLLFVGGV